MICTAYTQKQNKKHITYCIQSKQYIFPLTVFSIVLCIPSQLCKRFMKESGLSFLKCTASNCMTGTSEYVRHAALWRPGVRAVLQERVGRRTPRRERASRSSSLRRGIENKTAEILFVSSATVHFRSLSFFKR